MEDPANGDGFDIPRNMTDEADAVQMKGLDAIPLDMPNSEPGDMRLEYSLQNFNALCAANTAMEATINDLERLVEEVRARVGEQAGTITMMESLIGKIDDEKTEARQRCARVELEKIAAEDRAIRVEMQLQRALGYLDRCHHEEAMKLPNAEREMQTRNIGPLIENVTWHRPSSDIPQTSPRHLYR